MNSTYRIVDIDVTPQNHDHIGYGLRREVSVGENIVAGLRAATDLAYDFLAEEYGTGGLSRHALLADVMGVMAMGSGALVVRVAVPRGTTDETVEAFRAFCRDGIASRVPLRPACSCGAPSKTGWAGRAACWDHVTTAGVFEGMPMKPRMEPPASQAA